MRPKSELAWCLADYNAAGVEAPDRILAQPEACEGELMTPAEVASLVRDSIGTIMILLDSGSSRFSEVRQAFINDLDFLLQLGKISPDDYNEIITSDEMTL